MIKYKVDNFEGGQSPLIWFTGRLLKHEVVQRRYEASDRGAARDAIQFTFNFGELTVLESRESYPLPVAEIKLTYNERGDTSWSVFAESFTKLVPANLRTGDDPLASLDGRMQEWHFKPGKVRGPLKDDEGNDVIGADGKVRWGLQDRETWQIVSIEGMGGGPGLTELILEYIGAGRQADDIYQAVYTTQGWKNLPGWQEVANAVGERTLLAGLVATGKIRQETDGKYVKI